MTLHVVDAAMAQAGLRRVMDSTTKGVLVTLGVVFGLLLLLALVAVGVVLFR